MKRVPIDLVGGISGFDVSLVEARHIQEALRAKVVLRNAFGSLKDLQTVGGADVAFDVKKGLAFAAVVVLNVGDAMGSVSGVCPEPQPFRAKGSVVVGSAFASKTVTFPYIPGFLSFREGPVLIKALDSLGEVPDILIFDGAGVAHPRGLGLASHMGVLLGKPTIGCAKSRLVGEERTVHHRRGSCEDLIYQGKQVGFILRTRSGVKPVYVSPGHLVDFAMARDVCLRLSGTYRLPEPTRLAHIAVSHYKASLMK